MKSKVKRFNKGEFLEDNYAQNENREGRMSTLDPSDVEDAIRGRMMTGKLGEVEYPANKEPARVTSEYDAQAGLDYAPSMGNRTPIKTPAKPPIVTKEQMQKAGYSNLRDYLNAQQGLTRRGAPAKSFAPTPIPAKEDVPTATLEKKAKPAPTKRTSMFAPRGESMKDITRGMMKRPEGYAKGGSVGSASKRADGIAQRGKTRGKMI